MSEILENYRGALIFEIEPHGLAEGQRMGVKLIAKARLPDPNNLKVHFMEESPNIDEAITRIHRRIDRFLKRHEMEAFSGIR